MCIEKDTFENIVDKYSQTLFRIAYTYCGNRSDAEDIVQDTLLKYIKKHPHFENEEHEKAWLIRVAINLSKDYLKSYWFRNKSELTENIPAEEKESRAVWESVGKLSPKYRIVIELYYREGYSIKEISELLHKNRSTVGNQLARAKKQLEKILKEDLYG
ncbi:MAG: RNA polymerase sigma factor [Clostridia bacterium]|nr:RNA polymerase sigma factor [Clostridia bacterium]